MKAFEHHRKGDNKEALTLAASSLESTIKVICVKRGWPFNTNDTAQKLVKICFDKGLIPDFWASHFGGLRSMLESGVPTPRNRMGGHGQGAEIVEVPDHLAAYALHMTASAIVFLVEAEKASPA